MGKLSSYERNRIVSLRSSGVKVERIKYLLEEGIQTSRSELVPFFLAINKADVKRGGIEICRIQNEGERRIGISRIKSTAKLLERCIKT